MISFKSSVRIFYVKDNVYKEYIVLIGMEYFNILFLGTGSSVPTKLRNHTGILTSFANEHILLDCGDNIQRQSYIAGVSPTKITRILITHWHGDHILGLPGLLQRALHQL